MKTFIALAAVVFALVLSAGVSAPVYAAQSDQNDNSSNNVSHAMTEQVYRRLSAAQEDLKNKKYQDALDKLNDLLDIVKDNPYESAVTYQTLAYVYIDQENYKKALPYLKKSLDYHALPDQQQHQQMLTLAQLYASTEQYQKAINLLEDWFANEKNPPTSAYLLAATSYYQTHKLKPALKYIKTAINKSKKPHQSWYNLYLGIEFDLKDYDAAIDVLKKMITMWPDKPEYWRNLSGLYLQQKQDKKALSVLRIAYAKGYIKKGDQLLNLARLAIMNGIPYFAGEVIEKGIKSGAIKSNLDNWQLLSTAWISAKETDRALDALGKAGSLSDDGDFYLQAAQVCYQDGRWDCAAKSAAQALDKGGLKHPGKAYIMEGMALAQNKKYSEAKKAFHHAQNYDETRKSASNWIKYVDNTLKATS